MPGPALSEKEWQKRVMEYAAWRGWYCHHSRTTRTVRPDNTVHYATAVAGQVGFPDLTLARHGQVVFLELKTEKGSLSREQQDWLARLTGERVDYVSQWTGRDLVPDGRAFHEAGGWTTLGEAGDWMFLVAGPVRPRHWFWVKEALT